MTQTLKAWRGQRSQTEAAQALGVSRATYASYESGRRAIPQDVADKVEGLEIAPAAPTVPAIKTRDADPATIAQAAQAQLAQIERRPPGVRKDARRPTAQEVADHPQRYSGPDVWVTVYDPPERLKGGQLIARMIQKGSANGEGGLSVQLVGSCSERNPDREALPKGGYRPFRPSLGIATPNGGGPGGRKKAA